MTRLAVAPLEFVGERWKATSPAGGSDLDALHMVTLNTWFDPKHQGVRTRALLALLEESDADIVCLQEVTPTLLEALQADEGIREGAQLVVSASVYGGYGCAILSQVPIERAWELELPSMMARSLLAVELMADDERLVVSTVHLESTRSLRASRVRQLELIFDALEGAPSAVLVGDFNFDPSEPEEEALDARYVDLWPLLRKGEPGYTEDTTRNAMRRKYFGGDKHVRYDRILIRSTRWRPNEVALFADEPITPEVCISDHFGVRARFARS
ncbi:MAG: endonuclease/exonuclease/phosphatase family protein [Myxococcota bacterium]